MPFLNALRHRHRPPHPPHKHPAATSTPAPPPVLADDQLLLLSQLRSTFSAPVTIARASPLPPARRHLVVRGSYMLLLRDAPPSLAAPLPPLPRIAQIAPLPSAPAAAALQNASVTLRGLASACPLLNISFPSRRCAAAFVAHLPARPAAPVPAALASPQGLASLRVIGEGATCTVRALTSASAVKLLPRGPASSSRASRAALASERLAYALMAESPFAAKLEAAYATESHFALQTALAYYGDFHEVLACVPRRRVPPRAARTLAAEMVLALRDVHAAGLLFRDVKLANFLLTGAGHAVLADYGLVKRVASSVERPLAGGAAAPSADTSSVSAASSSESDDDDCGTGAPTLAEVKITGCAQSFVGTRRYMSPELCGAARRKAGRYGAASDVWALGVSLYLLLTGRYPFFPDGNGRNDDASARHGDEDDDTSLFLSIQHDDPHIPDHIPAEVGDVLRGMLRRDPLERLDLAEVMRMPWLRDVDWHAVRRNAKLDVPNEDVLRFLTECRVKGVLDRRADELRAQQQQSGGEGSAVTEERGLMPAAPAQKADRTDRELKDQSFELLGFDYRQ